MKTIFVSSTFKDMHFERDAIQEITLPALKSEAIKYGENVSFCDLRWGINTGDLDSEEGSRKVLDVCLDEIDRCKPPMVVILGDRYGWIPSEDLTKSAAERKKIELEDLQISVTALEIAYGALSTPERCRQALFYFRHIESDCPQDYSVEDAEHEQKLNQLKSKIDELTGGRIKHYSVSWNGEKLDGVISFAEMLAEDIKKVLLPEWKKKELLTPFERERLTHWSFITEKNEMFSARRALVQKYYDDLTQNGKHFLAIKAPSGSGKSMLFSNLALKLRDSGYDVVPFMSGLTSESNDSVDILRNAIYYIEDLLGFSHESVDFNFNAIGGSSDTNGEEPKEKKNGIEKLRERLFELCVECEQANKRVIIMVDAVDQLASDDNRDNLIFIPERFSANVKFVMTCLPELHLSGQPVVTLKPMDDAEKREVIEGILRSHNRELEDKVIRKMIKLKASRNPLFLSLLVQRLLMMNRDDFLAIKKAGDDMKAISKHQLEVIATCPDSLQKMSADLLTEAGKRINEELVRKVAEYLAVSRHGLRQEDLAVLLGDNWSALDFAHFITYMDENFIQRDDGRFDFSHKCIREGFLKICDNTDEIHRQIVEYLESLPLNDNIRMLECVYHYIALDDKAHLCSYIRQINGNVRANELAARDLFAHSASDKGQWICDILDSAESYGTDIDFLHFVNRYFDRNASGTLDEMRMRITVLDANVHLADRLTNKYAINRLVIADTYVHYAESRKDIDSRSYNAFSRFYWSQTTYYQKAFDIYNAMPDLIDDEQLIVKITDICTRFDGFSPYVFKGISIAQEFLKSKRNLLLEINLIRLYLNKPCSEQIGKSKFDCFNQAVELLKCVENDYSEFSDVAKERISEVYFELARRHPFSDQKRTYLKKYFDIAVSIVDNTDTLKGQLDVADIYSRYGNLLTGMNGLEDIDGAIAMSKQLIALHQQIYEKYHLKSSIASVAKEMNVLGNRYFTKYGADAALDQYKKGVLYLFEQLKDSDDLLFYPMLWILDEIPNDYSTLEKICFRFRVCKNFCSLLLEAISHRGKLVKIKFPMWELYHSISDAFYRVGVGDQLTYKIRKKLIKNDIRRAKKDKHFKWRATEQVAKSYGMVRDLCRTISGGRYKWLAVHYAKKAIQIQKRAIKICEKMYPKERGYLESHLAIEYRELGYCYEVLGYNSAAIRCYKTELAINQNEAVKSIENNNSNRFTFAHARLANIYFQKGNFEEGDKWLDKDFKMKGGTDLFSSKHVWCNRYEGNYWSQSGHGKIYGFYEEHQVDPKPGSNKADLVGWKRREEAIEKVSSIINSLELLLLLRNGYREPYLVGGNKKYPELFINNYEKCIEIDNKISKQFSEVDSESLMVLDYNDLMLLYLLAGELDKALKCGLKAEEIIKEKLVSNSNPAFQEDLSTIYRNIGEVYWALGDEKSVALAIEYFGKNILLDEALFYEQKLNRRYITLMLSYRRMALCYEEQAQFEKARSYHAKAFDVLLASSQADNGTAFVCTNLMEKMCFISNLLEVAEKTYLSDEERKLCYSKAIRELNWLSANRGYPWNYNAPMIIQALETKVSELKA